MTAAIAIAGLFALTQFTDLPVQFWGIVPEAKDLDAVNALKPSKTRAVVLIHGLLPRPLHSEKATVPEAHSWQNTKGSLVQGLNDQFDVFGFSYAQTVTADGVAHAKGLSDGVAALKKLGYQEIVLVGHSAGGIIARRFIETYPDGGVTKVLTVATPHSGSGWTNVPSKFWPKPQIPFIESLSEEFRDTATKCAKPLPKNVDICCVVCKLSRWSSDTMVHIRSQWPEDLQTQGVPAVLVRCNHFDAMTSPDSVKAIVDLTKGKVVRWKREETTQAQRLLFGEKK